MRREVLGLLFLFCALLPSNGHAQAVPVGQAPVVRTVDASGVHGLVFDPSGALIPAASVRLERSDNTQVETSTTGRDGRYSFAAVPAGTYKVLVSATGFADYLSAPVILGQGVTKGLDVHLEIASGQVHVDVSSDAVDTTDPNHNASAIVLSGKSLEDLPTDPTLLQQQLQAMSGGDSPAIYVDGFSNGTLPPKNTIREIRINQNPYSARNDTDPNTGMVEILTKPGTNKLHGDLYLSGNDSAFNTQNPFTQSQPDYYSTNFNADVDGPLSKNASYFLSAYRQSAQTNAVVAAEVVDASAQNQVAFTEALPSPSTSLNISPRLDLQLGTKNTVTLRYSYSRSDQTNGGVGQLNLAEQGYNSETVTQLFQAGNSQVVNAKVVNDTRAQYLRTRTNQTPFNTTPTLQVEGAFIGGGSNAGAFRDNHDSYEFQNYVSIQAGTHYLTPGVRLRINRDANVSRAGYNGEFLFSTLASYQSAEQALNQCEATRPAAQCNIAGASQFSITTGATAATVNVIDFAAFYQDDWKIKTRFTLSYGLRYEIQNYMSDHRDFAPRLGFAWGLGGKKYKPALITLRGGSGIFYQRLSMANILQAQRQNGVLQQQYVVASPTTYPNFPALGAQSLPAIYRINAGFQAPYLLMNSISAETPLGSHGRVSVEYDYNRGNHGLLLRNINAPEPGTYNPTNPTSGIRPFGTLQNINEFESAGVARTQRIAVTAEYYTKDDVGFYAYYRYRRRASDANGGGFVSNSYDVGADYGRAASDLRHGIWAGINSPMLYKRVNMSVYIDANSGLPFNITVAQDLNGDAQFNDRPAFATDLTRASVVSTSYGVFDTNPIAGQKIIPINYGQGPGFLNVGLEIRREFTFGPVVPPNPGDPPRPAAPAGKKTYSARRYNVRLGIEADDVINKVNLSTPVGTLGSPLFGQSTGIVSDSGPSNNANRLINLNLLFRF